jgi:hypothetical protein
MVAERFDLVLRHVSASFTGVHLSIMTPLRNNTAAQTVRVRRATARSQIVPETGLATYS